MKVLIIGAGSIGRRHATNLSTLGVDVGVYDTNQDLLKGVCGDPISDLDSAIESHYYTASLICTPTNLHVPLSQMVVDAGMDIFIEKPLSHSWKGVYTLLKSIDKKSVVAMAGFNLRYEPGLLYLKKIIPEKEIAFVRIECGSHMPTWRDGVDYRKVYSANKSMGGGIILDGIHELDYACWLFGYPDSVRGSFGTFSNFEIDVEDTANIQFTYEDKHIEIHLDYLQKRYTRTCKICLRDGNTIEWTFGEGVVEYTDGNRKAWIYKDRFNINDLYLEEIKTFLRHIKERTQPESDTPNAATILNLALRVKEGVGK